MSLLSQKSKRLTVSKPRKFDICEKISKLLFRGLAPHPSKHCSLGTIVSLDAMAPLRHFKGRKTFCLVLCHFIQLQKLTGRRNRREEINIVDVNADEQVGNAAEMVVKYGTEEETHRPSRVRSCSAVIGVSIIRVIVVSPMNEAQLVHHREDIDFRLFT